MMRPAALLVIACVALYAATLDHFFVSDDFLNIERNIFTTLDVGLALFGTHETDFYRPIPRLHFGLLTGFVADQVVVWNVVGVLLHALATVAAFLLALDVLGPEGRRAARYAGLAFALHFIHVEPVVWASGVTSLYVGLFVFTALYLFRRARATRRARDAVLAVVSFAAALLSKETAVVFGPLLFLTTWWWPPRDAHGQPTSRWPSVRELAPYAVLTIAYASIVLGIDRGGDASPYQMSVGVHMLKNLAFFVLGGFLPVRYWEIQALWAEGGGLGPFVASLLPRLHLSVPLLLGGLGIAFAAWRGGRNVRGGLLWIGVASLPFLGLPGSGERFQYVSSFGACLALGVLAQSCLQTYRRVPGGLVGARAVVLAGLLVLVVGAVDRQRDWMVASQWSRSLVERWGYLRQFDPEEGIVVRGLPGSWRSAWAFRNGFSSMVRLYWEGRPYWREGEPAAAGVGSARVLTALVRENGTLVLGPAAGMDPPQPGP